jgi:glucosamine-6-phosphate deaminase
MVAPRVFPSPEILGAAVADEIVDGMAAAARRGRRYLLGCPGGRSPLSTYRALAAAVKTRELELSHVVIVEMDEYLVVLDGRFSTVPIDAHYSVAGFAEREIVGPLNMAASHGRGIPADHVWRPSPDDAAVFDDKLAAAGGIDLFILASGDSDGHVAMNPPGSDFHSRTRVVELAASTRSDNLRTFPQFASLDEVPRYGVTVGIATIATLTRRAILVAPGRSKHTAVARIAAGSGYDPSWPATVLNACRHPSLYTDKDAAGPSADNCGPVDGTIAPISATEHQNQVTNPT